MAKGRKKGMSKKDLALENLEGFIPANEVKPTRLIPTGHPDLDYILGRSIVEERKELEGKGTEVCYHEAEANGGLPSGKLVMFYGGEGSGKSSLAYKVCANAQEQGLLSAWFDVEHSFAPDLAKINNLDIEGDFILKEPGEHFYAEAILDDVIKAAGSGLIDVIVVDSVAALVPKYVYDNPTEKDTMALLARVLSKSLSKLAHVADQNNVLVVFINQLRVNPGVMFGNPEGCPGGKALAHLCSVICKLQKVNGKEAFIYIEDDNGEPVRIAGKSYVRVEKNRFSEPHDGNLVIPIYYKPYHPSIEDHTFTLGRQLKLISVRKGIFKWNGISGEGKHNFIDAVKQENSFGDLIDAIREAAELNQVKLPLEVSNFDAAKSPSVKAQKAEEQTEVAVAEVDDPEL